MKTILIADDDTAIREMLVTKLANEGFVVVAQAGNGVDAVRLATLHTPDVAVIDLMMPWVNGYDAIREITATCPETRILVFSVLDEQEDERLAREVGADAYLRKGSTSPNQIADAVHALVGA